MKLEHLQTVSEPEPPPTAASAATDDDPLGSSLTPARVEYMAWSRDAGRLAVCHSAVNQISLWDGTTVERKDRFHLKPFDKSSASSSASGGRKSFAVKGLAFCPSDANRLAVAQTDTVIYVYKLGARLTDKKSIQAKYAVGATVTAMLWIENGGIVYGTLEGKVKLINTTSSKTTSLMTSKTDDGSGMCTALAATASQTVGGTLLAAAFLDGAVTITYVKSVSASTPVSVQSAATVLTTTAPVFGLCLTSTGWLAAGASDGRLILTIHGYVTTDTKIGRAHV